MFGLIVLLFLVVYGALMIGAIRYGWRRGRRNGGSKRKAAAFASLGFLVVYLPVFWNHVPVLLRHQWLCASDAGFTQYVEPSAWRADHANEIRELSPERAHGFETRREADGSYVWRIYGGLLDSRSVNKRSFFLRVPVIRKEEQLLSTADQQLLAKQVNYLLVGARDDIRSWIFPASCWARNSAPPYAMEQYVRQLKGEN
jgi:hypothetical protein